VAFRGSSARGGGEHASDERGRSVGTGRCGAQPLLGDRGIVDLTECILERGQRSGETSGRFADNGRREVDRVADTFDTDADLVQLGIRRTFGQGGDRTP
jgi:hypothetical protein